MMIGHLGKVLLNFPGAANQTWCFMHTINLCAKSILKHFDLPKKKNKDALDQAANALANLACYDFTPIFHFPYSHNLMCP
jgi:hypothetical protein